MHVVDEAHRLAEARRRDDVALRLRLAQGPVCMGRAGGSMLAFLVAMHRAGESLAMSRAQVRAGFGLPQQSILSSRKPSRCLTHSFPQLESREAWLGIEGAMLVVPNELERSIGFDHGALLAGSELNTFALRCRDRGTQFAWLDAPVDVPSPASLASFVSHRREAIAARLAAASMDGEGMPGALSLDRRAALLMFTGACTARKPGAGELTHGTRSVVGLCTPLPRHLGFIHRRRAPAHRLRAACELLDQLLQRRRALHLCRGFGRLAKS